MTRKVLLVSFLALMLPLASMAGIFRHKKSQNPLENLDSKQPDKVLFDRSMDFMKHSKYEQARTTLQVLINTYPDSEYIARAKLAIGDAWYNEGGTTGLAQAEIEYKDFITFFPNMPEAAEAQLKVANIHYRQMEKPDRDSTHARRAEEEYQQLILQFPDSKLVPLAQQRLREVQEVLAEKEFGVGKQYFMRESWPAAIARLQTAVDTYPLYSKAPESLYMLGQIYDIQAKRIRDSKLNEGQKARLVIFLDNKAAAAYDRIIMNYPLTARATDAKHRLQQMNRTIPAPTPDALEKDKALEASRSTPGKMDVLMHNFRRAPDVKQAAHIGDPTMTPQPEVSPVQVVRDTNAMLAASSGNTIAVEVRKGEATASDPIPGSANQPDASTKTNQQPDAPAPQPAATVAAQPPAADTGIPELKPIDSGAPPAAQSATPNQPAAQQLQFGTPVKGSWPTIVADPQGQAPAPAPAQINDAAHPGDSAAQPSDAQSGSQDQSGVSSSKGKKKKKGLGKLNPF